MMGKEIELKLEVPPRELRRLKDWRVLPRDAPGKQDLASVYFDTPKHELGRNGISLRIRRNGKKRLQTIKSQGADYSFRRGWEHEIKGDVPRSPQSSGHPAGTAANQEAQAQARAGFRDAGSPHHRSGAQERKPNRGRAR